MKKNQIFISVLVIISAVLFLSKSTRYELAKRLNVISAGSYAFAEVYNLPYSETNVINAIEKFKENNPEYQVSKVTIDKKGSFPLEDFKSKTQWFVAYFYDPEKNRIFNIAIRGNEAKTNFGFVSVNESLDIGNWKDLNKDFSYDENERLKKEFEKIYLNPIKEILNNK
jgi:hypothetical protein